MYATYMVKVTLDNLKPITPADKILSNLMDKKMKKADEKKIIIKHWKNETAKRFWALIDEAREQGKKEAYKNMSQSCNVAFCNKCGMLYKAEHKNCKSKLIYPERLKTKHEIADFTI